MAWSGRYCSAARPMWKGPGRHVAHCAPNIPPALTARCLPASPRTGTRSITQFISARFSTRGRSGSTGEIIWACQRTGNTDQAVINSLTQADPAQFPISQNGYLDPADDWKRRRGSEARNLCPWAPLIVASVSVWSGRDGQPNEAGVKRPGNRTALVTESPTAGQGGRQEADCSRQ